MLEITCFKLIFASYELKTYPCSVLSPIAVAILPISGIKKFMLAIQNFYLNNMKAICPAISSNPIFWNEFQPDADGYHSNIYNLSRRSEERRVGKEYRCR